MKYCSKFMKHLASKKFTVSGEVDPPKDVNPGEVREQVGNLKGSVVAANVTDNPIGDVIMNTLAPCVMMQEEGLEAIYQQTCRDRNRIGLQSDILGASALGMKNILALTGDHTKMGNHPQAKPVFDLDSTQLTRVLRRMRDEGKTLAGTELEHPPEFHIGVGISPGVDLLEAEVMKLEKKVAAGAEFAQTQLIYDTKILEKLKEETEHLGLPIMPGFAPLKSVGMAKFMLQYVPGIRIPQETMDKLEESQNLVSTSIEIVAELIAEARDLGFPGVHIMPVGMDAHVAAMVERAGEL